MNKIELLTQTSCIVPGITEVIRTYGQDGSVGCSRSDTSDPSAWEDNSCQLLVEEVVVLGLCSARAAYSDLMDW